MKDPSDSMEIAEPEEHGRSLTAESPGSDTPEAIDMYGAGRGRVK